MKKRETIHSMQSPFPIIMDAQGNPIKYPVINEYCMCRHPRTHHRDTAVEYGHGVCVRCTCSKFTWTENVHAEDP